MAELVADDSTLKKLPGKQKKDTILDTQRSVIWEVRAKGDLRAVTNDDSICKITVNFLLL